jgi:hypothetical protein
MPARRKTAKKTAKKASAKHAKPSPRNGVSLPVGAHPGNTGGKAGRSGRKPDEFKEALAAVRDTAAMPFLVEILGGEVRYVLRGTCAHCGKESSGPEFPEVLKLLPTPDARLRAADMSMRYTVGLEKTVRLEGVEGTKEAYDIIRRRILATLGNDAGSALIDSIKKDLLAARL